MSTTSIPKLPRLTRDVYQPCGQRSGKEWDWKTLDDLWHEALPFICLAVVFGTVAYLVVRN